MEESPVHDRGREVQAAPGVAVQLDVHPAELAAPANPSAPAPAPARQTNQHHTSYTAVHTTKTATTKTTHKTTTKTATTEKITTSSTTTTNAIHRPTASKPDASRRGEGNGSSLLAIEMKAPCVLGRGEERLLCNPDLSYDYG